MIVPGVNVLVYAWNSQAPEHAEARAWLAERVADDEPLALSELVLSGAVRVLTMPQVRTLGHPAQAVLEVVDELLTAPGVRRLRSGPRHWGIFRPLASGNPRLSVRGRPRPYRSAAH